MSPRYSTKRGDHMEYTFWLVFGDDGTMRMSRGEPDVQRGERAMAVMTRLPLSLFQTPTLTALVTIADAPPGAYNLDVAAASDALRGVLGVDIDLRVTPCSE